MHASCCHFQPCSALGFAPPRALRCQPPPRSGACRPRGTPLTRGPLHHAPPHTNTCIRNSCIITHGIRNISTLAFRAVQECWLPTTCDLKCDHVPCAMCHQSACRLLSSILRRRPLLFCQPCHPGNITHAPPPTMTQHAMPATSVQLAGRNPTPLGPHTHPDNGARRRHSTPQSPHRPEVER